MLTPEQETWIAHLSDENKISVVPFDSSSEEKFQEVRRRIQKALGSEISVEHRGASSLGISGQNEIDVYIPTLRSEFETLVEPLKTLFGEPRSFYPYERARFVTEESGKHVDVFLINEEHEGWKQGVLFETYLKSHPDTLDEYRLLKEDGNGLSVREYYRRKTEFINEIVKRVEDSENTNSNSP